ncbi:ALBINO3-like protein 2, chloroplastic isoform X2 [Papaver somniferum]|uniref:ALBINO3-like protein 2, chloroplastic isoform X2 n=1 Tax=Papaver somniferum TaxID=3469 RepID=UPI000E701B87|nr:ALBINO3-like protein 2, chloroplastic isoform X2 [Papaver somniferum]
MGVPKLITLISRIRPISSYTYSSSLIPTRSIHSQIPNSLLTPTNLISNFNFQSQYKLNLGFPSFQSLSIHTSSDDDNEGFNFSDLEFNKESDLLNSGFDHSPDEVVKEVISAVDNVSWYDPAVQTVVSLQDGFHGLTNLPWWIVIASSTLALRLTILPVLVLQFSKAKQISELFPKLPPPLPPPFSGKSIKEQFLLFRKERKAIGCPSYLWNFAYISVQIPCFLLWMHTIRRMSLEQHPGFDCGGALWFQNLTQIPHGSFAVTFPILIAGLHYVNIQLSFRGSSVGKVTGVMGKLFEFYKLYLDVLTIPIFVIGFFLPQGSLVYWVTNSSITVIQNLSLQHPTLREKLGLPDKNASNLSPDELLSLPVQLLSKGHHDRALPLLRLAIEKDPDHIRSMVVLGQSLMQKQWLPESIGVLEHAVRKLLVGGQPAKEEEVDLLILASTWAGVTNIKQGKNKGLEHLERISQIEEPVDPKGKAHYFDGLELLSSALFNEGRKVEAEEYLRKVVAYDPSKNDLLQQLLEDEDDAKTY